MILNKRSGVFKAEWRQIKGFEGYYAVSNLGQVRSLDRVDNNKHFHKGIILKQKNHRKGYKYVGLCKNSKSKAFKIHRLVAIAFIPNKENKPQTDHINTIKNNNRIWNLRWVTRTENANNPISKKHNSESKKGKPHPISKRKGKKVLCIETNIIYNSITECSKFFNTSTANISLVCNGKHKTTKGYHFKFVEK